MVTRVVQCKAEQVKVGLGTGSQLILFKGDHVTVKDAPDRKGRFQVLNGYGEIIGTLTKTSLDRIAGKKVNKRGEKHALEAA